MVAPPLSAPLPRKALREAVSRGWNSAENAMNAKGLSIAVLVLAALCGVLYWSNHRKPAAETAASDLPPKILSLNQADIVRLAIREKDKRQLDLSRNDSGAWQIAAPESLAADQDAVSSVISTFASLNADRLLDAQASNLASYGLTAPAVELDATLKDHKTKKLLIGDQTPSGSAYYAMVEGDPRLFTVAGYDKSSLDKTASDLRDKRLLTADFDKVSQIELIRSKPGKAEDITLARNKDAWQILKPGPFRADSSQVEGLIDTLRDARLETGTPADDAKNAAAFRSAASFFAAKITGASGTQELQIRKAKNDYYAHSSVVTGFYKVLSGTSTSLDKSLDDLRNKKLFDFGYEDPGKIEIHDGGKNYFLTRSGSDWWGPNGKRLDSASVQPLLDKIRSLAASKFPDSGFAKPALEISVLSNDGKRAERVSIAKNGDRYIAKRENEPALYELSATAVQDLQKAAADLKPEPPPKPAAKK